MHEESQLEEMDNRTFAFKAPSDWSFFNEVDTPIKTKCKDDDGSSEMSTTNTRYKSRT